MIFCRHKKDGAIVWEVWLGVKGMKLWEERMEEMAQYYRDQGMLIDEK